jgi:hypothetical protein
MENLTAGVPNHSYHMRPGSQRYTGVFGDFLFRLRGPWRAKNSAQMNLRRDSTHDGKSQSGPITEFSVTDAKGIEWVAETPRRAYRFIDKFDDRAWRNEAGNCVLVAPKTKTAELW